MLSRRNAPVPTQNYYNGWPTRDNMAKKGFIAFPVLIIILILFFVLLYYIFSAMQSTH